MVYDPESEPTIPPSTRIGISLLWPFIVGSIFLLLVLGIVAFGEDPTPTQFVIYRIIIALGGAGFAVALTGHLQVQFPIFQKGYIKAAAAFAVFVILYFFTPASLVANDRELEAKRLIDQYRFGNSSVVEARERLGGNWELSTAGLDQLAETAKEPTQETLESARSFIAAVLSEDGASLAFTKVVNSHLSFFDCIGEGACDQQVVCGGMFAEIEGFRNLFCEQIIDSEEALNNGLWARYKDFSHNSCRSEFLSYYVLSKNINGLDNLKDVCLPVQCWAKNTAPPYPCQLRQQLLGGSLSPA